MLTRTKNAPTMRRTRIKISRKERSSIIAFLTEKNEVGYPRWFTAFFVASALFISTWGAVIVAPLMWLGVL